MRYPIVFYLLQIDGVVKRYLEQRSSLSYSSFDSLGVNQPIKGVESTFQLCPKVILGFAKPSATALTIHRLFPEAGLLAWSVVPLGESITRR